jgi:hypothetical protein
MKELIRDHETYSMAKLPKLKFKSFLYNGNTGFTGSIVRRPIKDTGIYWHYGFFYGFDSSENLFVIENNKDGVECVCWKDFLSKGISYFELIHYEPSLKRFDEILSRAKDRAQHEYTPGHNNCEHFANYCVHEKFESFQAEATEKIANSCLSLIEIWIAMGTYGSGYDFSGLFNDLRKQLDMKRLPELEVYLNNHKKEPPRPNPENTG